MTLRGKHVSADIDAQLARAEADLAGIRAKLRTASEGLERSHREEGRQLGELAQVRLDALEAKAVRAGLDRADRQALVLLDKKRERRDLLDAQLAQMGERWAVLRATREAQLERVDRARAAHAQKVHEVHEAVRRTDAHAFQVERLERADDQAEAAAAKAEEAQATRVAKGAPYEGDKLFNYLWARHYGDDERYKANLFTRWLDGWVAGLCDYDRARRDYAMLLEIPVRLREHADALAEVARGEQDALDAIENAAMVEAGVPALVEAGAAAHVALVEIEQEMEGLEARRAEAREALGQIDADEDPFTQEALALLEANMEREPVATLRADARGTATSADDAAVRVIAEARRMQDELQADVASLKAQQERTLRNVRELESLRAQVRRRKYDSEDSVFHEGVRVRPLLEGSPARRGRGD